MMDWLHKQLWNGNEFRWWVLVGGLGMAVFSARFLVQWYATEKRKQVVVPAAFWWLSLLGSVLLLLYAFFYRHDAVFILSYAFSSIPYIRNLIIQRRHSRAHLACAACATVCPPQSSYCFACGARLPAKPALTPS